MNENVLKLFALGNFFGGCVSFFNTLASVTAFAGALMSIYIMWPKFRERLKGDDSSGS